MNILLGAINTFIDLVIYLMILVMVLNLPLIKYTIKITFLLGI